MNDELSNALLRELEERLKSVEQRLTDMQAAEQEMSKTYSKSQELYRQSLKKRKHGETFRGVRSRPHASPPRLRRLQGVVGSRLKAVPNRRLRLDHGLVGGRLLTIVGGVRE